jgi:hypothetical protein
VGGRAAVALATLLLFLGPVPLAGQSRFTLSPYLGALFVDGSCVYEEEDACLGFSDGDPAVVLGAVASYEIAPAWRVEATYARSSMAGDPIPASTSIRVGGLEDNPAVGSQGVPFWTALSLAHATVRHSLVRTPRSDVYATGSIGRIAFDGRRAGRSFADLLLGAGLGLRIGGGPIALRADGRMFTQPCSGEERELERLACDDGSWLTHAEVSGGVVLTFPGIGSAAFRGED